MRTPFLAALVAVGLAFAPSPAAGEPLPSCTVTVDPGSAHAGAGCTSAAAACVPPTCVSLPPGAGLPRCSFWVDPTHPDFWFRCEGIHVALLEPCELLEDVCPPGEKEPGVLP